MADVTRAATAKDYEDLLKAHEELKEAYSEQAKRLDKAVDALRFVAVSADAISREMLE